MSSCKLGAMLGMGNGDNGGGRSDKAGRGGDIASDGPPPTDLFVATTLESFEEPKTAPLPNEITVMRGTTPLRFRKLSPAYFAWIHSRYQAAEQQYEAGKIGDSDIAELYERYLTICDWLWDRIGEDKMKQIIKKTDVTKFVAPQNKVAI